MKMMRICHLHLMIKKMVGDLSIPDPVGDENVIILVSDSEDASVSRVNTGSGLESLNSSDGGSKSRNYKYFESDDQFEPKFNNFFHWFAGILAFCSILGVVVYKVTSRKDFDYTEDEESG